MILPGFLLPEIRRCILLYFAVFCRVSFYLLYRSSLPQTVEVAVCVNSCDFFAFSQNESSLGSFAGL